MFEFFILIAFLDRIISANQAPENVINMVSKLRNNYLNAATGLQGEYLSMMALQPKNLNQEAIDLQVALDQEATNLQQALVTEDLVGSELLSELEVYRTNRIKNNNGLGKHLIINIKELSTTIQQRVPEKTKESIFDITCDIFRDHGIGLPFFDENALPSKTVSDPTDPTDPTESTFTP